jgi:hypothetical protein
MADAADLKFALADIYKLTSEASQLTKTMKCRADQSVIALEKKSLLGGGIADHKRR